MCICLSSPKVVITFFIIKHCPCCQLLSLSTPKFREQRRSQLILAEILSEIIQIRQNLFELCLEQVTEFQIQQFAVFPFKTTDASQFQYPGTQNPRISEDCEVVGLLEFDF